MTRIPAAGGLRIWPIAAALGVMSFGFRLLGTRGLTNDHYMYLAWAQQLLAGDLPGRDFVDPGMPLAYASSAAVQAIWPGPFSEAVLTAAMLAIAAAVTYIVVTRVTGSVVAGIGGALVEIALLPRLYSYPKILVPAVMLWLLQQYMERPSRVRLGAMAVWTAVAGLLRYDLGLYAATAFAAGLLVFHWPGIERRAGAYGPPHHALGFYLAALCVILVPYGAYVQFTQGLVAHLHDTAEFMKNESWPDLPVLQAGTLRLWTWTRNESAAFLFYTAYVLAGAPVLLLLARRRQYTRETTVTVMATIVMSVWYLVMILRHPIAARIPDLAALVAVAGAWTMVEILRLAREGRLWARGCAALATAALLGTIASVWVLGNVSETIRGTRVLDGWSKMREWAGVLHDAGTEWPWARFWPNGGLPEAVRFLNECTASTDRIVLTWAAPEFYYFSRRPSAAGHVWAFAPPAFTSSRDQDLMVNRLHAARAPYALINETRRDEFARGYPQLDRFLRDHYVPAGSFTIYDGSRITIGISKTVQPRRVYGETGWHCSRDSP